MKNKKGITLIALVVTIIVLLILAGVTLSLVAGENGILRRATNAVDVNEKASAEEQANLVLADIVTKYYEEKYVNNNAEVETMDAYIQKELETPRTTEGGYTVQFKDGKVEVSKKEKPISSGEISNGKVEWTGSGSVPSIPEGLKVGSTVTYAPSGTYDWNAEYATSYTTTSTDYTNANQSLNSGEGGDFRVTSWRVLRIEGDQVQMVPSAPPSGTVRLHGAQGYNNAVKLLNDACGNLYSDSAKGITARSINIEDIEGVMDEEKMSAAKAAFSNTNSSYSYLNDDKQVSTAFFVGNSHYPLLYGREKLATIDGPTKQSGLGMSEQSSLIGRTDTENGKTATAGRLQAGLGIQPYQTYYGMNNSDFSAALGSLYTGILLPNGSSTKSYWVASRCINCWSGTCGFVVRFVNSGGFQGPWSYLSSAASSDGERSLFPIISLHSSVICGDPSGGFRVQ